MLNCVTWRSSRPHFIDISHGKWKLKAETHICPQLKYDCHSTDFHGNHVCSKPTLKNCCIEFHENLPKGLVANTSHMQGRDRCGHYYFVQNAYYCTVDMTIASEPTKNLVATEYKTPVSSGNSECDTACIVCCTSSDLK